MTAALGLALAVALAAPAEAPFPPPRPALEAATAPEAGEPTAPGTVALVPPEKPAPAAAVRPVPMPAPDEMVCRDPRLTGDPRPPLIETGTHACGIFDPVRVRSVAGMRLKPPIVVECPTARRLANWLDGIVRPQARERFQARVAVVRTMGSYACRTRNHVAGGRLSEHGRGRAVDIGGFTLADGGEPRAPLGRGRRRRLPAQHLGQGLRPLRHGAGAGGGPAPPGPFPPRHGAAGRRAVLPVRGLGEEAVQLRPPAASWRLTQPPPSSCAQ